MAAGDFGNAGWTGWIRRILPILAWVPLCLHLAETPADAHVGVLVGTDAFVRTLSDQTQYVRPRNAVPIGGVMTTFPAPAFGDLHQPEAIAVAPNGRSFYIAETARHLILRVDTVTQTIRPFAGGNGPGNRLAKHALDTQLNGPRGIAVSADSKTLYVADTANARLLEIDATTGRIRKVSIELPAESSEGNDREPHPPLPNALAASPDGKSIFVGDGWNHQVLRIDLETKKVERFAGDNPASVDELFVSGDALNAAIGGPSGLAVSPDSSTVFIVDDGSNQVLAVDSRTTTITTVASHDLHEESWRTHSSLKLTAPMGVATSPDGKWVVVADSMNNRVVRLKLDGEDPEVVLGPPEGDSPRHSSSCRAEGNISPQLNQPSAVAVAPDGSILVADSLNDRIILIGADDEFEDQLAGKIREKTRGDLVKLAASKPGAADPSAAPFMSLRARLALTLLADTSSWCSIL